MNPPSPDLSSAPDVDQADIAGACPHCHTEVPYESWIEVADEPARMGCPFCRLTCLVDDVFHPA